MSEERGEQEIREPDVLHALIRLLQALNDNQAHGREDATVVIGTAELQAAGVVRGSPLYDKVMQHAQERRFLIYGEESATAQAPSSATGDLGPYKFTHNALEMLRWGYKAGACLASIEYAVLSHLYLAPRDVAAGRSNITSGVRPWHSPGPTPLAN